MHPQEKDTICLTISEGLCRSMRRLWMRIWKRSHVFEPSPHGVLRVVIRRILVGMRTGPFTFSSLSLAPRIRSAHTAMTTTPPQWCHGRHSLSRVLHPAPFGSRSRSYFKINPPPPSLYSQTRNYISFLTKIEAISLVAKHKTK